MRNKKTGADSMQIAPVSLLFQWGITSRARRMNGQLC